MSEASSAVRGLERHPVLAAVAALYDRAPHGLIRFLVVGFGGLAVDIGVLTLLERYGVRYEVARALSLPLATLATWTLNRRFTFGDTGRRAHVELGRYIAVAVVAQGVNYLASLAVRAEWPHLHHAMVAFAGAVAATAFSYTGQRFFTFAPASKAV